MEGDDVNEWDTSQANQANQALVHPVIKNVTNVEFRSTIHILGQFLMAEANREIVSSFNPNVNPDTSRVRDIYRMKPLKFHRSKVDEDLVYSWSL